MAAVFLGLPVGIDSPLHGSGLRPAVAGSGAQNGISRFVEPGVLIRISRHRQIKSPALSRAFYLWR